MVIPTTSSSSSGSANTTTAMVIVSSSPSSSSSPPSPPPSPPSSYYCPYEPAPTRQPLPIDRVAYAIHDWSSYSATYHPKNILVDKPHDQSSRWSSGSSNQSQFVTLKLEKLSIVTHITFGKFHKVHVCNLKEFKVFGGLQPDNMIELLQSGLRNDDEPETFPLKHKVENVLFPCQYIRIVPLMAWGPNFNFSIWYVELAGVSQPSVIVDRALESFTEFREQEGIRLCLKYLRQKNYTTAFDALLHSSGQLLEHPILTELHTEFTVRGNFQRVEEILEAAAGHGLFAEYLHTCTYRPQWTRIFPADQVSPRMRGGHQMCIDAYEGKVYLYGGWDGTRDLGDLWEFNCLTETWTCLSNDTKQNGGPGPRSCHKICLDDIRKYIYTLGGYVDPEARQSCDLAPDFYRYEILTGKWVKLSDNVNIENGPELIYDHQMCIDPQSQTIYVFGGRSLGPSSHYASYSGLYKYSVTANKWTLIRSDSKQPSHSTKLISRIGHSMLLNPRERYLYILAGQRNKDYLSDFYVYDIDTDEVTEMTRDSSKNGGPDAGFTQRATIDLDLQEIYLFSGLMRERATATETVKNSFWVYNIKMDKWTKVYQNENMDAIYWAQMQNVEPCPRFAHQLVYDHLNRVHYLFGGNPGDPNLKKQRLDDFWSLRLRRPQAEDVLRNAIFLVRRQQFREMCQYNSMVALKFLQTSIAETVNHEEEKESQRFRSLTPLLFQKDTIPPDQLRQMRSEVFEELLKFFPIAMRQPRQNLFDLVQLFLNTR